MGFELSKERISVEAKEKGVWKSNPKWTGVKWLIASSATTKVKRAIAEMLDPVRETGIPLGEEEIAKRMARIMSDHLLLDWEGDISSGGEPLPYTKENAYDLLMAVEPLRDWIIQQSDRIENFREELLGKIEGNSEAA